MILPPLVFPAFTPATLDSTVLDLATLDNWHPASQGVHVKKVWRQKTFLTKNCHLTPSQLVERHLADTSQLHQLISLTVDQWPML
jgi:hypothetical protein